MSYDFSRSQDKDLWACRADRGGGGSSNGGGGMSRRLYTPEQIIGKLREAEAAPAQGVWWFKDRTRLGLVGLGTIVALDPAYKSMSARLMQ